MLVGVFQLVSACVGSSPIRLANYINISLSECFPLEGVFSWCPQAHSTSRSTFVGTKAILWALADQKIRPLQPLPHLFASRLWFSTKRETVLSDICHYLLLPIRRGTEGRKSGSAWLRRLRGSHPAL